MTQTKTPTTNFPLVVPTKTQVPTAQLILRNEIGQVVQQWLVKQNKCTLGSSTGCTLRCELEGIAPYHALLVVGARQIFLRALAPKVSRDGKPVNEVLITDEQSHFEIAGHRFELQRAEAKSPESINQRHDPQQDQRLKFAVARPLELQHGKRVNPSSSSLHKSQGLSDRLSGTGDSAALAKLVQSAIEPLECRIQNLLDPIAQLQEESKRQRELTNQISQRQLEARQEPSFDELITQRLAQESSQNNAAEQFRAQVEELTVRQSAAMDVIGERITDVNQQLSAIESIIGQDIEQERETLVANKSALADQTEVISHHTGAIEQLQNGIVSVSEAIQSLEHRQEESRQKDDDWKAEIQEQVTSLRKSIEDWGNNTTDRIAELSEKSEDSIQTLTQKTEESIQGISSSAQEAIQSEIAEKISEQLRIHDETWNANVQEQFERLKESVDRVASGTVNRSSETDDVATETWDEPDTQPALTNSEEQLEVQVEPEDSGWAPHADEESQVVEPIEASDADSDVVETDENFEVAPDRVPEITEVSGVYELPTGQEQPDIHSAVADVLMPEESVDTSYSSIEPIQVSGVFEVTPENVESHFSDPSAVNEEVSTFESSVETETEDVLAQGFATIENGDADASELATPAEDFKADVEPTVEEEFQSSFSTEPDQQSWDSTETDTEPSDGWQEDAASSVWDLAEPQTEETELQKPEDDAPDSNVESLVDTSEDFGDQASEELSVGGGTSTVEESKGVAEESESEVAESEQYNTPVSEWDIGTSGFAEPEPETYDVGASDPKGERAGGFDSGLPSYAIEGDSSEDEWPTANSAFDKVEDQPALESDEAASEYSVPADAEFETARPTGFATQEDEVAESDAAAQWAESDSVEQGFVGTTETDHISEEQADSDSVAMEREPSAVPELPSWWSEQECESEGSTSDEAFAEESSDATFLLGGSQEEKVDLDPNNLDIDTTNEPNFGVGSSLENQEDNNQVDESQKEEQEFFGFGAQVESETLESASTKVDDQSSTPLELPGDVQDTGGFDAFGAADSYSVDETNPQEQVDSANIFAGMGIEQDEIVESNESLAHDFEQEQPVASHLEDEPQQKEVSRAAEEDFLQDTGKTTTIESIGEEGDEEEGDVEDYMRKLLARMRGVPDDEVSDQVEDTQVQAEPASISEERPEAVAPEENQSGNATVSTNAPDTVLGLESEDLDSGELRPRISPPEQTKSLAAMRELANSSARTAIHKSTRERQLSSLILKGSIAVIGLIVGIVLLVINGVNLNIGLVATIAAFLVAGIWGYDSVSSLGPILQAGLESVEKKERADRKNQPNAPEAPPASIPTLESIAPRGPSPDEIID